MSDATDPAPEAVSKKKASSARAKLRAYFLAHVGEVVDWRPLRDAAGGITEWARRVRELRQIEGFDIRTDKDDSTLKPGQYKLASSKPRPVFADTISKETRAYVLDRNGFTCQMCGAAAGEPHPTNPSMKTRLHIGHIIDLSQGGTNDATNLRALCSVCNEGAANATLSRPHAIWLLGQVRRAGGTEQLEVLEWLARKFPTQARKITKDE
jgi:HNH endonuclease